MKYAGWPKGWAVFNLAKEVWQMNEGDLPYEDETMRAHAKEMVFPIGQPNDRKCIKVAKTNNYKGLCIRHTFVKKE